MTRFLAVILLIALLPTAPAQAAGSSLWLSPAEIAVLPMSGPARARPSRGM
jgi:hypothetical protein